MENMNKKTYRRVLTIAGSDPSGGAGLQADLKTFAACGCYGASAVVAVVDENTVGVTGIHPIPVDFVTGQIRSVLDDIGADAIKIGMLHSSKLIHAVRDTIARYPIKNIVLDPVMVATSGDPLLEPDAVATLRDALMPHVRIITPNIPEAELLLGEKIESQESLPDTTRKLSELCGGVSVLLKAGHLRATELTDVFYNAESGRHTRHRLHPVVGIRCIPCPWQRPRPGRQARQRLYNSRHRSRCRIYYRPRERPRTPLPCILAIAYPIDNSGRPFKTDLRQNWIATCLKKTYNRSAHLLFCRLNGIL